MNYEQILRALLAKVYKKQETETEAILSATDETQVENAILALDASRVSELSKPKIGSTFQDGYAKAKKEVLTNVENQLKDAFEISDGETPLTGAELISEIVAKKTATSSPDASKLTTEDIRKLPAFQPIQREFTKQLTAVNTAAETKVKEIENGYKKKEVFTDVSKKALEVLNGLNPVLPKTETVAQKQKSSFLTELNAYEWEIQDGVLVPIKDGKVAQDPHGNALTLEEITKTKAAEYFEFATNNGGGNAGNGKPGEEGGNNASAGGGYPKGIPKPKTLEDLTAITNNTEIPAADRQMVLSTWEAEQQSGTR